jgi:hypothetical protein
MAEELYYHWELARAAKGFSRREVYTPNEELIGSFKGCIGSGYINKVRALR